MPSDASFPLTFILSPMGRGNEFPRQILITVPSPTTVEDHSLVFCGLPVEG
jgi:hypothetical protein